MHVTCCESLCISMFNQKVWINVDFIYIQIWIRHWFFAHMTCLYFKFHNFSYSPKPINLNEIYFERNTTYAKFFCPCISYVEVVINLVNSNKIVTITDFVKLLPQSYATTDQFPCSYITSIKLYICIHNETNTLKYSGNILNIDFFFIKVSCVLAMKRTR